MKHNSVRAPRRVETTRIRIGERYNASPGIFIFYYPAVRGMSAEGSELSIISWPALLGGALFGVRYQRALIIASRFRLCTPFLSAIERERKGFPSLKRKISPVPGNATVIFHTLNLPPPHLTVPSPVLGAVRGWETRNELRRWNLPRPCRVISPSFRDHQKRERRNLPHAYTVARNTARGDLSYALIPDFDLILRRP